MGVYNEPLKTFTSYLNYMTDPNFIWDKFKNRAVFLYNNTKNEKIINFPELETFRTIFRIEDVTKFSPLKIKQSIQVPRDIIPELLTDNRLLQLKKEFDKYPVEDSDFIKILAYNDFKKICNTADFYPKLKFFSTEVFAHPIYPTFLTDFAIFPGNNTISPEFPDEISINRSLGKTLGLYFICYKESFTTATFRSLIRNVITDNSAVYLTKIKDDLQTILSDSTFIKELISHIIFLSYSAVDSISQVLDIIYSNTSTDFINIANDLEQYYTTNNSELKNILIDIVNCTIEYYINYASKTVLEDIIIGFPDYAGRDEQLLYEEKSNNYNANSFSKFLYLSYLYTSSPLIFLNTIPNICEEYTEKILITGSNRYIYGAGFLTEKFIKPLQGISTSYIVNSFNNIVTESFMKTHAKEYLDIFIKFSQFAVLNNYLNKSFNQKDSILKKIAFKIYNILLENGLTTSNFNWSSSAVELKDYLTIQLTYKNFTEPNGALATYHTTIKTDLENAVDSAIAPTFSQNSIERFINNLESLYSIAFCSFYNSIFITSLAKRLILKTLSFFSA